LAYILLLVRKEDNKMKKYIYIITLIFSVTLFAGGCSGISKSSPSKKQLLMRSSSLARRDLLKKSNHFAYLRKQSLNTSRR
jgi:hypothetical protein